MFPVRRARLAAAAAAVATLALTAGCSSGTSDAESAGTSSDGSPSGEILVLTNRTDIVDTVFKDYVTEFNKTYPDVKVKFEALTDYPGEVKTRMNTKDYGDVLLIPSDMSVTDLPDFFEPLGSEADLSKTYRFTGAQALDGTVYGLATFGNASGVVYNKKVFADAGVTDVPTTPDEFYSALEAIKAKTDATPFYTNYKDGWPLTWPQDLMGAVSGDKEAKVKMAESDAPWASGQEKATLDSILYEVTKRGLVEADPTTTNWEESKNLIGTGKIGVMVLGSWAVPQMQEAATKAGGDAADIGFMPAPFGVDGAAYSPVGPDWTLGINVNSENKAAARAWLDWFVDDSGFYDYAGGVPTRVDQPSSANLTDFEATGVEYVEMTPAPKLNEIANEAEIGLTEPDYYRLLVDSGRGATNDTEEQIFTDLDTKWAAARATVG